MHTQALTIFRKNLAFYGSNTMPLDNPVPSDYFQRGLRIVVTASGVSGHKAPRRLYTLPTQVFCLTLVLDRLAYSF